MDRWSDVKTWGNDPIPTAGDFVFVPKGQTLLVDQSSPKLKAVIVEGVLIFEDTKDLTFDSEYIFIRGGRL
jgi:hypothetical protein